MPDDVGVRELRQNLSKYLARVKEGESLVVRERGKVVARLVPAGAHIDPYVTYLAERYGATIPKGSLDEAIERVFADDRPPAPSGTVDALLEEMRRDRT
jgi:prevent-host-death family protein